MERHGWGGAGRSTGDHIAAIAHLDGFGNVLPLLLAPARKRLQAGSAGGKAVPSTGYRLFGDQQHGSR
jgi:hypothetical protein